MPSTAVHHLESLLQARRLDRTVPRSWEADVARAPTGVPALDEALEGGWRRGEVSEILGCRSSGRTGVLISTLAAAIARGELVGLVDAFDRFDPVTAAAAGLDLDRVLWVRGASLISGMPGPGRTHPFAKWRLIEEGVSRAVRALDLIVRAGGFGIAALDLAGVPARAFGALPYTTWMRLAHANEGQPSACLLVGEAPMGRSARGASVELDASGQWTGSSRQSRRFAGFDVRARIAQAQRGTDREPQWMLRAVC
jgi:recA bacterial DNA recombination protein